MNGPEIIESFLHGRVTVRVGDITKQDVDVIVNAANSSLLGGGGVDGAIHRTGGPQILLECRKIRDSKFPNGLPTGEAVITSGGNLPARHVIHTVGPIRGEHDTQVEADLLSACYVNSLTLAVRHSLRTIAFPSISTGAFSYPREEAAVASSTAIMNFLAGDDSLDEVRLVFFAADDANVFVKNQRFALS
jgi:O-acetyl-ADP-ribose deacetylase (regulator of RNase III)